MPTFAKYQVAWNTWASFGVQSFFITKYKENKFNFEDLADKIMSVINDKRTHESGSTEVHGGGGKKIISTVKQIVNVLYDFIESDVILLSRKNCKI